jgi:ABC-type transport system substrate-binding protein
MVSGSVPSSRFVRSMALWLAAALLTTACDWNNGSASSPSNVKTFHYAMRSSPGSLDPARASTVTANEMVQALYDSLYVYKYLQRPYELKPRLAAAMPEISEDGLTYTIRLKPGIRFVDNPAFPGGLGREVVAEDFVYALKRHFDPATRSVATWVWQERIVGLDEWKRNGSDYDQPVEGLQAIEPYVLQIKLTRPYPQLVHTLAMGPSAAVPREAVELYGREFSINPVGSGPFRLVSYNAAKVVLVPNENFRREPVDLVAEGYDPQTQGQYGLEVIDGRHAPFVERLEISFIDEGSARWSSFTKGNEVQMAGVPTEQIYRVLASRDPVVLKPEYARKYHVSTVKEAGFVFTVFNMDFPEIGYHPDPVRNERNRGLRCAIVKARDWNARNDSWYGGLGEIFPGVIPPAVPEFDPELSRESVEYDPEGARALLAEHGWNAGNLPELVYSSQPGPTSRLFFEQFRGWLTNIGYPKEKIVLKTYATFSDLTKAWRNSEEPIISAGWLLDYPDAESSLQLFYGPNRSPGSNDSNYSNPEYDRLYEMTSVMLPSPERTELYGQMNRLVIDDCVAISGLSRVGVGLWHKNVVALPDHNFVGGQFLQYVDVLDTDVGGAVH